MTKLTNPLTKRHHRDALLYCPDLNEEILIRARSLRCEIPEQYVKAKDTDKGRT